VLLGRVLERMGRRSEAIAEYRAALAADPRNGDVRCELARVLGEGPETGAAVALLREGITMRPGFTRFHVDLARLLGRTGDRPASVQAYESALRLDAGYPGLRHDAALALLRSGRPEEAATLLRALGDQPDDALLRNELGCAFAAKGEVSAAAEQFQRAVELDPENADDRHNLGLACESASRWVDAAAQYRACLKLEPERLPVVNELALLLASCPDERVRDGNEALELAGRLRRAVGENHPNGLDTLAAALAELGRFEEAVATARRAAERADAEGMAELAGAIRTRIALYQARKPYRRG
jgi:tetratricopeptide (TPR) repeat protein